MRPFLAKRPTKQQMVIVVGSIGLLIILGYILVAMEVIALGARTPMNQLPVVPTVLISPTDVALEKIRLENEKLAAEITKLQREIQPDLWALFLANIPVIVGAIVGLVGIGRWIADRRDAREKRLDDRFQSAVEGLGSEQVAARIQAAAILLNFLQPGYERFYKQIFDLSITNLGLQRPSLPTGIKGEEDEGNNEKYREVSQTALFQVLVRLFKESFPQASKTTLDPAVVLDATYAYLAYARLINANLANMHLPMANLSGADLSGAILAKADLSGADLSGADLSGADLSGAILARADLSGADLSGANLSKAFFMGAKLSGTDFMWADLSGANLFRVDLREANFTGGANLAGANLAEADLSGAEFSEVDLSGAELSGAVLTGTNFSGAKLSEAFFLFADLTGADLTGADLTGANLAGADLTGANLIGTKIKQEQLDQVRSFEGAIGLR